MIARAAVAGLPAAWRMRSAAARVGEVLTRHLARPSRELDLVRLLAEAPQAVPRLPRPDDDRLPRLAAASLAVHALLLMTALWHQREAPIAPREIAVELVTAPEPKAKPAKPTEPAKRRQPRQRTQKAAAATRRSPPRADKPSPMPALALPGASETDPHADAVSYAQLVLSKLAKAKKEGRYMGVPGYAGVRFRLGDDGGVESVKLASSSGDPALEIEAVAMVRRAAPYPPPPPGGRRDYAITLLFEARP